MRRSVRDGTTSSVPLFSSQSVTPRSATLCHPHRLQLRRRPSRRLRPRRRHPHRLQLRRCPSRRLRPRRRHPHRLQLRRRPTRRLRAHRPVRHRHAEHPQHHLLLPPPPATPSSDPRAQTRHSWLPSFLPSVIPAQAGIHHPRPSESHSRIAPPHAAIPISLSRATRYSCGRSPFVRLQCPHSSCRLSMWSVYRSCPRNRPFRGFCGQSRRDRLELAAISQTQLSLPYKRLHRAPRPCPNPIAGSPLLTPQSPSP